MGDAAVRMHRFRLGADTHAGFVSEKSFFVVIIIILLLL